MVDIATYLGDPAAGFVRIEDAPTYGGDPEHVHGALVITVDGKPVTTTEEWDDVDDLWRYVIEVSKRCRQTGEFETYFPDQPVLFRVADLADAKRVLISISADGLKRAAVAPAADYYDAIARAALTYFEHETRLVRGAGGPSRPLVEMLRSWLMADSSERADGAPQRDVDRAFELIAEHDLGLHAFGGREDETIDAVEQDLGLVFPPSYRHFLKRVGACAVEDEFIFGIAAHALPKPMAPDVGFTTSQRREATVLPPALIPVWDDPISCGVYLDTAHLDANGEAPAIEWFPGMGENTNNPRARDFGELFLRIVQELIE